MPRTKVPKKSSSKRNRDQSQEQLQAFEELVSTESANLDLEHSECLSLIEEKFKNFIKKIPANVLNMKVSELEATAASLLLDASKTIDKNQTEATNVTSNTQLHRSRNQSKEDEGYLTEACTSDQGISGAGSTSAIKGPLASARGKQLRRSKSALGALQSAQRPPMPSRLKAPTPLKGTLADDASQSQHTSRSAYRTPLPYQQRVKAASADRVGNITPKVPMDRPVALLRFPKIGETLVSLTGSPVTGAVSGSYEASVNIPTVNGGVLSLRPTPAAVFDANLVGDIDEATMRHLHQLQQNINTIMALTKKK
ncbi:hypothetical protein DMENIID0001_012590 [Sergentomyia squamirostris]